MLLNAGEAWDDISRGSAARPRGLARLRARPPGAGRLRSTVSGRASARSSSSRSPALRSRSANIVFQEHKLSARAPIWSSPRSPLVYFVQLAALGAHFDRYVLPLVPVLGALAGRIKPLVPLALLLLLVPLAWSVGDVRELTAHRHAGGRARLDRGQRPGRTRSSRSIRRRRPSRRGERSGSSSPAPAGRATLRATWLRSAPAAWITRSSPAPSPTACSPRLRTTRARRGSTATSRPPATPVLRVEPGRGLAGPWVALYRL